MSKHQGRRSRWSQKDAKTYLSAVGTAVYRQDAWYARLVYRVRQSSETAGESPVWVNERWLGPFKRPRNAMVELEREVTVLRNRHGDDVQIGDDIV